MENLQIAIELLSETIFGSGETVSNSVDIEVLQDSIGIPYMKGKTFKGKLREEVEAIANLINISTGKDYKEKVEELFGKEGSYSDDTSMILETLKFSNCEISQNIKEILKEAVENNAINKEDILGSFTDIRSFTSIDDNGIAKDGSLREGRVIKKNITYYVSINVGKELTNTEKGLIAAGVQTLKNLGAMESRGKGRVKCKLLENGKDVTMHYINKLEKGVK